MAMHNLIEHNDNCPDTSGSLWGFKRDEVADNTNWLIIIMILHLKTKQTLLVILKKMEQKRGKNICTTKIFE